MSRGSRPFHKKLGNTSLRAVRDAFQRRSEIEFDKTPATVTAYRVCIFAAQAIEKAALMCDGLDVVYSEKDIEYVSELVWDTAWRSVRSYPETSDINPIVLHLRSCVPFK